MSCESRNVARLAQSVERKALNLVVVGSSPTVGSCFSLDDGGANVKLKAKQMLVARRPCGPMDKASVYGTGDCRFESYQGQLLPIFE